MSAALRFDSVSAGYGNRAVLDRASAQLSQGRVTGIVGPNGAGKTTLFRVALGLLPLTAGTVTVLDNPLASWSREGLARSIAYLAQGAEAHWPITARRLAALGRLPHRAAFASLTDADAAIVDEALARCDASAFAERSIDELSSGERARVLLARALATAAPILLADEPAAHLDPAHQIRLMELLRDEAARGTAVGVTLHDLSLAARYCDEIVVVHRGAVVAQGVPDEALSDARLGQVFGVSANRTTSNGKTVLSITGRI
ncbi:MAG TPA: ABC transporter ATP-binding protein [Rhizomicrobium sp.]|jgi:iron complex transport system ATP-binding protein|nr:ABC transporter ATP-binding protein [Rhizomicrobium sp.]